MSAYDSLGAIAQQFTQGFKSSKAQEHQQGMEDAQLAYDRAGRLFQMADQVQDPRMKDALFSSATQLVDAAGTPGGPAKKSNPKSFGSILGGLFGIGHAAPPHPSVLGSPDPSQPSPFAGSPLPAAGSNTSGSIAQQFGPEIRQNPRGEGPSAPAASTLPNVPAPMHEKAGAPGAILDDPNTPQNTPREMAMIMAGIPLHEEGAPAAQASPIAAQFPGGTGAGTANVPTPSGNLNVPLSWNAIRQRAIDETKSPQYGFLDPKKQAQLEQRYAGSISDQVLKVLDSHLQENPEIRTLAKANVDPTLGPEFRRDMLTLQQYEAEGMIPKGTVENWQKNWFDDVRFGSDKFNPQTETDQYSKTVETPDGKRFGFNPKTHAYDIQIGGSKPPTPAEFLQTAQNTEESKRTPEQRAAVLNSLASTPEGKLRSALGKAPESWSPDERALVNGEKARLAQIEDSKKSNVDKLKDDAITELLSGKPGKNVAALKAYEPIIQPPPVPVTMPGINPATNRSEIMIINRNTGKAESTGIRTAGSPFIPERYQKEVVVQTPSKINPRIMDESKDKVFNADALMAAHSSGDPSVSLDTLVDLLNSHANFDDRAKLNNYVNSKLPTPAFTSTTK